MLLNQTESTTQPTWSGYDFKFTATSALVRVSFHDAQSPADDNTLGTELDNVRLDAVTPGSPYTNDPQKSCDCSCNCPIITASGTAGTGDNSQKGPGDTGVAQASLVYNSDSDPVTVVDTDYTLPDGVDDYVTAQFTFNGVAQSTVYYSTAGLAASTQIHIALQANVENLPTGRYDYDILVKSYNDGSTINVDDYTGVTEVVNREGGPFGNGGPSAAWTSWSSTPRASPSCTATTPRPGTR